MFYPSEKEERKASVEMCGLFCFPFSQEIPQQINETEMDGNKHDALNMPPTAKADAEVTRSFFII